MNVADFEDLLDRLGEDMSNWPVPQQEAAAVLLRSSDEARALLDQAKRLRRALSAPPIRAGAGLADRIMLGIESPLPKSVAVAAEPSRSRIRGPADLISSGLISPRSPGFILAACFFIGICVGLYPSLLPDRSSQVDFPDFLAYAMDISRVTD